MLSYFLRVGVIKTKVKTFFIYGIALLIILLRSLKKNEEQNELKLQIVQKKNIQTQKKESNFNLCLCNYIN